MTTLALNEQKAMRFYPEQVYHIYNRGNNRQKIFFEEENYVFFPRKVRRQLLPHVKMLCYCLMPNHFHFLIYTRSDLAQDALNKAIGLRDGTLCDRDLACELLDLPSDAEAFYQLSYQMIDPEKISRFL